MTPLARRVWLVMDNAKRKKGSQTPAQFEQEKRAACRQLEDSICFDVSDVRELIGQTVAAMAGTAVKDEAGEYMINHGGLAVMPHHKMWVEWQQSIMPEDVAKLRAEGVDCALSGIYRIGCGLSFDPVSNMIGVLVINSLDIADTMSAELQLLEHDMCQIVVPLNENHNDKDIGMCAGKIAQYALAALCIVNAPYAIKADVQPVHKAQAREARQRGFELKPHHVVTIHKTAPPRGLGGTDGHGAAKAFHFVRGHLRRLGGGKLTSVKAHFRGDPRLGILSMPDYRVKE